MFNIARLDEGTVHGLMKAIMEANYSDAVACRQCECTGVEWDPSNSDAKMLEMSLSALCTDVGNAMLSGELNPFHGDYREWLIARGYLPKSRMPK